MLGIFVDVENELTDIAKEAKMLSDSVVLYQSQTKNADAIWTWLAIQGLASGIEKIYTGCERVMDMIASDLDGARIDHREGWHVSLLK